ncbi:glutathione S-transferase theta-3-like isoform X1 [Hylaeus volcanicus]|uniref:glutathione S-transferase theta-3-like isoform X1 n=1 Tax=Hylaeus volcanicus TaxID=313075 RepID=UPI0023B7C8D8|nr:glutathione S-transferase theta-3-like isoform X1 [Hylaeus volcanicus]XP_053993216.1 glutathione S-transferase theta-3-like isoform X1 [Hylaeus volcanicus]
MSLKLYIDLLSQPSRALYIFFKVCNIPFESKIINLGKMQHLTEDYQTIHPFQQVPAIDHNGFKVFESGAILRYITREFNTPDHWYPKDSKSQVKVDEYLEWHHLNTRLHCASYFRQKYLMPMITGEPAVPEKIVSYEKRLIKCLNDLEKIWLNNTPYLVGSEISIADILGSCEIEQLRVTGFNPYEGRSRLAAWMKRVADETSPHYQEAHMLLDKLVKKTEEGMLKSKF